MATYEIQLEDGSVFQVEAGDNIPENEIRAQVMREVSRSQPQKKTDFYKDSFDNKDPLQKFLIGAGGGMMGLYKGVQQRLGLAGQNEINEYQKSMNPINNSGAGIAGNITGNIAGALPTMFIPGVNTAVGATLTGAGLGFVQPTTEQDSVLLNTALGAAGGRAGKWVGDKVSGLMQGRNLPKMDIPGKAKATATAEVDVNMGFRSKPVLDVDDYTSGLSKSQQKMLGWGKEKGFKQTPGYASGSKPLQQMEARLESQPGSSGQFFKIKDENQRNLNRIAAKSIGESGDEVSDDVLGAAEQRISNVYKNIATDDAVPYTADDALNIIEAIDDEFESLLPIKSISDEKLVGRLLKYAESGQVTTKQLQNSASKLGKKAYQQMTSPNGDREFGLALYQVKDHIDDVLSGALNESDRKAFNEARRQYRNLMLLTKRMNVVNPAEGNVKGGALGNALKAMDKKGYMFGKNQSDLYNAARFYQAFPRIVGDSGTATRMPQNTLEAAASIPISLATKAYTSSPVINSTSVINDLLNKGIAPNNRVMQELLPYLGISTGGLLGGTAAQ